MTAAELYEMARCKSISPDHFLDELKKLANGVNRTGISFGPETTIFRTRVFSVETKPNFISELSYPPIELTMLQRANARGEQIFYGSFGFNTALVESRVKVNEFVIISEWKNVEDLVLIQIGLSPEKEALNEINKLLHDIFTCYGEDMYVYSSKIAFHFLRGDIISGIIYPSISSKFDCHNVAIHKEFVDQNLEFVQAYLYQVTDISNNEEFEVNELSYATKDQNGYLTWENGRTGKLYF